MDWKKWFRRPGKEKKKMMKECPICHKKFKPELVLCRSCGAWLIDYRPKKTEGKGGF